MTQRGYDLRGCALLTRKSHSAPFLIAVAMARSTEVLTQLPQASLADIAAIGSDRDDNCFRQETGRQVASADSGFMIKVSAPA
jgi:hypothetical protein